MIFNYSRLWQATSFDPFRTDMQRRRRLRPEPRLGFAAAPKRRLRSGERPARETCRMWKVETVRHENDWTRMKKSVLGRKTETSTCRNCEIPHWKEGSYSFLAAGELRSGTSPLERNAAHLAIDSSCGPSRSDSPTTCATTYRRIDCVGGRPPGIFVSYRLLVSPIVISL